MCPFYVEECNSYVQNLRREFYVLTWLPENYFWLTTQPRPETRDMQWGLRLRPTAESDLRVFVVGSLNTFFFFFLVSLKNLFNKKN